MVTTVLVSIIQHHWTSARRYATAMRGVPPLKVVDKIEAGRQRRPRAGDLHRGRLEGRTGAVRTTPGSSGTEYFFCAAVSQTATGARPGSGRPGRTARSVETCGHLGDDVLQKIKNWYNNGHEMYVARTVQPWNLA